MGMRLYTRDEVAEIFRVHPETIVRWVSEGRLRERRIGPRISRYLAEDIEELVRQTKEGAPDGQA